MLACLHGRLLIDILPSLQVNRIDDKRPVVEHSQRVLHSHHHVATSSTVLDKITVRIGLVTR
jgi:hypothetical protein